MYVHRSTTVQPFNFPDCSFKVSKKPSQFTVRIREVSDHAIFVLLTFPYMSLFFRSKNKPFFVNPNREIFHYRWSLFSS